MKNKTAQQAYPGFKTLMMWILIILVTITLLVLISSASGVGWEIFEKIKNIFPFA